MALQVVHPSRKFRLALEGSVCPLCRNRIHHLDLVTLADDEAPEVQPQALHERCLQALIDLEAARAVEEMAAAADSTPEEETGESATAGSIVAPEETL